MARKEECLCVQRFDSNGGSKRIRLRIHLDFDCFGQEVLFISTSCVSLPIILVCLKLLSFLVFCFGKHKSTPIQFQLQLCPMQVVQYSLPASVAKLLSTTIHIHSSLESTWCTFMTRFFSQVLSVVRFFSFSSLVVILWPIVFRLPIFSLIFANNTSFT